MKSLSSCFQISDVILYMCVILCSWKRGPYAFYINLGYFGVGENQGLLAHSQSDITLVWLRLALSSYNPLHLQQYPKTNLSFYIAGEI